MTLWTWNFSPSPRFLMISIFFSSLFVCPFVLLLLWCLSVPNAWQKKQKKINVNMKIPENSRPTKRFSLLPTTDEMLESENASMGERLYDLERQVLEQQEEILSLKSTLAEVLRRLNSLDCNSSRISSSTSSSSSYETTIKNNRSEYICKERSFPFHLALAVHIQLYLRFNRFSLSFAAVWV